MTCNGASIYCDFSSENYSWYDGNSSYLAFELENFLSLFQERQPDVVLDIGAHWGYYPSFLNNSKYSGVIRRIIAVEADPANRKFLANTLAQVSRIPVLQVSAAISDCDGYINLYSGGGSCAQTYCSSNAKPVGRIPALSLDQLVERYLKPGEVVTHIKLDIDGYEPAFFAGGEKTLRLFRPSILMEFWAQGLIESGVDIWAFWEMLHKNYYVQEARFSDRRVAALGRSDLSYLVDKTKNGITNLILVPR